MGQDKALLRGKQSSFLGDLTSSLERGGCDTIIVVVPDAAGPVAQHADQLGVPFVVNPGGGTGQLDSLRVAFQHLEPDPTWSCCVFSPVDCPLVEPELITRLIRAVATPGKVIALPVFRARRGHPVCVARSVVPEFMRDPLPEGARSVIRSDPKRVTGVPVGNPLEISDIDTPAQYVHVFNHQPRPAS